MSTNPTDEEVASRTDTEEEAADHQDVDHRASPLHELSLDPDDDERYV